ncbi:hypothetical protein CH249_25810 [Rhodococcus sp. 05-2255-3B1]|uniref:hypothetical protein n=1 Tax=Rhodococcus sp. 05-2255-3B1 TaxID=2022482 RepID=UPI000B9B1F77|nr:hypothetical protein [Rhodococcus sp. 05-2255-3B1]OZE04352.1 hypothetical protein CH249_25810 [Rhodococcus sp. 05-2255-3B1]
MSTVNPTHIIAEHRAQLVHAHAHSLTSVGATMNLECLCGGFATAGPYSVDEMYALHAAHVVSKLTDAGYSIVETERYERLQRGANELGRRLGRQLQDVLTLTGAHNLIDEDGDGDWMGVWERLGELVEKGQQYEAARRIEAATTTEEVRAVIAEFLPAAAAEGEKP